MFKINSLYQVFSDYDHSFDLVINKNQFTRLFNDEFFITYRNEIYIDNYLYISGPNEIEVHNDICAMNLISWLYFCNYWKIQ